jgi:hypothetical protein
VSLRDCADLVHRGINWLLELDRKSDASAGLVGVSPRAVVAAAFASTLLASGQHPNSGILYGKPT